MRDSKTAKKRGKIWIFLLVLFVIFGLVGGIVIKELFFNNDENGSVSNQEANRLIRYLSLSDYEYSDRLGSSFTVEDAKKLIQAANISEDKLHVTLKHKPGFMPLTREEFVSVYNDLIQLLDLERLSCRDLYIYGIDSANDEEIDGVSYEMINTNEGNFYMEKDYGMSHSYENKVVEVYVSNNEIIL